MKPVKMIDVSRSIITLLCILFVFISCKQTDIIEQDKMANVYVDILIIKEQYILNTDSLNIYQKGIFDKYGIKKLSYQNTLKSYKYDKDVWKEFFKKVYARIDTLKNQEERSKKAADKKNKLNSVSQGR